MKTYIITPNNGDPFELEAASVSIDQQTQRVTFKDDNDNIVGWFINVTFRVKPSQA